MSQSSAQVPHQAVTSVNRSPGARPDRARLPSRYTALAVNAGLVALWLWLYRAVYPYLGIIFTRQEFRTNQIVLIMVAALVFMQLKKKDLHLHLGWLPQLSWPALALTLGGSLLYLVIERFLDINTFSATLFGLATYGLLGLWMQPRRWREGLPAALLLVGALPFGEHMQTFIGYPVRILTASAVSRGLAALGVHSVGVDTILVFENGFSKVDLPCSGVKSLWTGGLFFLAATWIERRPVNLRWLAAGAGFTFLLLAANLGRVAVLVVVGQVGNQRLLAEMLHVPLGVLGFAGACGLGLVLLRWSGRSKAAQASAEPEEEDCPAARPAWLPLALGGAVLVMALLYMPRPQTVTAQSAAAWNFPEGLSVEPWALTTGERQWLAESEVESAERWKFTWRGQSGSMLFVSSSTWRAHHRPERCFEVYGLTVESSSTDLVSAGFPVRLLSLGSGKHKELFSAAYWLQSPEQITDDYATRIWADLSPQRSTWVLVTILFDGMVDPASPDAQALYLALSDTVHLSLSGVDR